jgi:ribosome biogenesis GTPase A
LKLVRGSDRYRRSDSEDINLLVLGIPNVGKSTFINKIRNQITGQKQQVAKVGDRPGVTRAVQEKIKISYDPLVYIYDTPGIMQPTFQDKIEDPLKLAACG